jgi:uncharacterized protein
MQFVLNAFDGDDAEAPARRQNCRPAHIAKMSELRKTGNFISGGAILDDAGNMIGSTIIYEFTDRAAFDAYLKTDPYVTGKVWQRIDVRPFQAANIP